METVIAIFIITFAILIMAALFRSALQGAKRARKVTVANVLANRRMEEIVYWAGEGNNFANWAPINVTATDSQFPDFTVSSESVAYTQYSPCSETETRFPIDQQRTMIASARNVRVRVVWAPTSDSRNKVELTAVVGGAPQTLAAVNMTTLASVAATSAANVTAGATDSGGQPIPDLFYIWNLSPLDGSAEVKPSRDGRMLKITNSIYDPATGSQIVAPGNVSLSLKSSSMGLTQQAAQEIYMQP